MPTINSGLPLAETKPMSTTPARTSPGQQALRRVSAVAGGRGVLRHADVARLMGVEASIRFEVEDAEAVAAAAASLRARLRAAAATRSRGDRR